MNAPEISPFSSISQRSQLMDSSVPAGVVLHASGKDIRGFPTASNAKQNKLVQLKIYIMKSLAPAGDKKKKF